MLLQVLSCLAWVTVSYSLEFVACLFLFPRLFLFLFTITDTNYGGEDIQIQHNRMSWNEETLA